MFTSYELELINSIRSTLKKTLHLSISCITLVFTNCSYAFCFTEKCELIELQQIAITFIKGHINDQNFVYLKSKKGAERYLLNTACDRFQDFNLNTKPMPETDTSSCFFKDQIHSFIEKSIGGLAEPDKSWHFMDFLHLKPQKEFYCAGATKNSIFVFYSEGGFLIHEFGSRHHFGEFIDPVSTFMEHPSLFQGEIISCPVETKNTQCFDGENALLEMTKCINDIEDFSVFKETFKYVTGQAGSNDNE